MNPLRSKPNGEIVIRVRFAGSCESKNRSAAFRTGGFSFCGGETSAEKMQRAEIFDREFSASFPDGSGIKIENERNLYLLADLGEEKCGLLTFDIEVEEACDMSSLTASTLRTADQKLYFRP